MITCTKTNDHIYVRLITMLFVYRHIWKFYANMRDKNRNDQNRSLKS